MNFGFARLLFCVTDPKNWALRNKLVQAWLCSMVTLLSLNIKLWTLTVNNSCFLSAPRTTNNAIVFFSNSLNWMFYGSSRPEVFLKKGMLKICRKFTGENPCRSVISIKLQSSFSEIVLRHGCPPVNFLHIFRTPFPKNMSRRLFWF